MNVAIFDDDKVFANAFKNLFLDYFQEYYNNINIQIITDNFSSDIPKNLDIAFVDIDLKSHNGIRLADYLKKISPITILIFVSSREDLVFKALSVDLFHFIRKSKIEIDSLIVFDQLKDYLDNNYKNIIIDVNGRKKKIYLNEIVFILSIGKELIINENFDESIIKSSIAQFLEIISSTDYKDIVQINRNIAINLNYVSCIKKTKVYMIDETEYDVGKVYQKNLLERYEAFLLR